jgi:hypothetical protein
VRPTDGLQEESVVVKVILQERDVAHALFTCTLYQNVKSALRDGKYLKCWHHAIMPYIFVHIHKCNAPCVMYIPQSLDSLLPNHPASFCLVLAAGDSPRAWRVEYKAGCHLVTLNDDGQQVRETIKVTVAKTQRNGQRWIISRVKYEQAGRLAIRSRYEVSKRETNECLCCYVSSIE